MNVNKPGFMLNPTNCAAQQVSATLSSAQGASAQVSSPFGIGGCKSLPFTPDVHGVHAGAHEQSRRREPGREDHLPAGRLREHRQNA